VNIRNGRGENPSANGQDSAAEANRFGEIAGYVRQRREKKIAKVMAGKAAPGLEAVLKQPTEQRFFFRKRHHAVADIAGRKDAIFAAEPTGTPAIIGYGDNRSKLAYGPRGIWMFIAATDYIFLEAAKQCGQSGAPAEGDNAEATR
jgi:hypothetical protein